MRIIYCFISAIILCSSCVNKPDYVKGQSDMYNSGSSGSNVSGLEIRYFKDLRTNLCFAERGYGDSYTMTCVPCDSITLFLK